MIHPTAVVDPRAEIDSTVEIGPFAVVDGPVRIGAGTSIGPHAVILGKVVLGEGNRVHAGAILGDVPQDLSYEGAETGLRIGRENVFREGVQVHRGTKAGTETTIGDRNFLMSGSHVAHNARLGNDVILATGAVLAGYVEVDDRAFVSGNCVVHQFVRIGRLALLRGLSRTSRDVPPYCVMDGTHTVRAVNVIGCRRAGMPRDEIQAVRRAYRDLFFGTHRNLRHALEGLDAGSSQAVAHLIDFVTSSKRGVCFGPRETRSAGEDA